MEVSWNMWRDKRRLIWGSFVSACVPGGTCRKLLAAGVANMSPASSCWSQTGGGTININPLPTAFSFSVVCHFIMCCHIYHTLVCYIELNVLWLQHCAFSPCHSLHGVHEHNCLLDSINQPYVLWVFTIMCDWIILLVTPCVSYKCIAYWEMLILQFLYLSIWRRISSVSAVIPTEQFLKWDCSRQCEKRHLRRTKRTKLARWTTNNSCFSGSSSTESHIWSISPCSRLPLIMDASFSPIGVLQGINSPSQPPTLLHCGSHHWLSRLGTGLSLYIISLSDLLLLLV